MNFIASFDTHRKGVPKLEITVHKFFSNNQTKHIKKKKNPSENTVPKRQSTMLL